MRNNFYEYLKSLKKEEIIDFLYKPYKKFKKIDFNSYRTIALKLNYDGEMYKGLAEYKYGNTIGNHIKNALLMSNLGEQIIYAGRTDSGVSAICMIASLLVKSRICGDTSRYNLIKDDMYEFKYDSLLNTYLPSNIRIIGWAPVEENFNARFSCIQRQYRYYFSPEGYNLDKMHKKCEKFLQIKNFYNFCKHSDKNVKYNRSIDFCTIINDGQLVYLDIRAKSFLHNMIRKLFWVLDKIGKNEEYNESNIGISSSLNLVFWNAVYPVDLNFVVNEIQNKGEQVKSVIKSKILQVLQGLD